MTFAEAVSSGFRHDAGFSGRAPRSECWWWQLFVLLVAGAAGVAEILPGLIRLIGAIILIIWVLQRGTAGDDRFGPDPLAG